MSNEPKHVLVTGGCGFIGSSLCEALLAEGHRVRVLDNLLRGSRENLGDALYHDRLTLRRGSVESADVVRKAVSSNVDAIYHLAATNINRSQAYPLEAISTNVQGMEHVLDAAKTNSVDRVVFASSASVYGDAEPPMVEGDAPNPETPYGIAKLAGEQILDWHARQGDFEHVSLRFFNVYGPGQSVDAYYTSVINTFVGRLFAGESPVVHGSGEQSMDFVHVDDVVSALLSALETDATDEIYNVASGTSTTIAELATELIDIVGVDAEPTFEERDVLVSRRRGSTAKAEEMLGFTAQMPLREGLRGVVDRADEKPLHQ